MVHQLVMGGDKVHGNDGDGGGGDGHDGDDGRDAAAAATVTLDNVVDDGQFKDKNGNHDSLQPSALDTVTTTTAYFSSSSITPAGKVSLGGSYHSQQEGVHSWSFMLDSILLRKIFESWDDLNVGAAESLSALRESCFPRPATASPHDQHQNYSNSSTSITANSSFSSLLSVADPISSSTDPTSSSSSSSDHHQEIISNLRFSAKSLQDALHVAEIMGLLAAAASYIPPPHSASASGSHQTNSNFPSTSKPTSSLSPVTISADISVVRDLFVSMDSLVREYAMSVLTPACASDDATKSEGKEITEADSITGPSRQIVSEKICALEDALRDLADGFLPWVDILVSIPI
ncbi:hypothetical protein BC829DRAFT_280917 [Chytridium lagenaria]|nr:hypothetical protein BC829DRAFT_280917 [Chytridium lagenaria]